MFSNNLLMAAASASGGGGYSVDNSIRMDKASTANMVLNSGSWGTPSSTTSGIISLWTKGGGATELLFHTGPQDGTGNDEFHFEIEASQFATYQRISAAVTFNYKTTQLLRDPTSWYHILVIYNTDDATSTDRIKIFINGVRVTDFATSTAPSSGAVVRFTADENNRIGTRTAVAAGGSMNNYLSQFAKLDGYGSYTEADFGEFDDEGEWRPIDITGLTYGTNGALLDFAVAPGTGNGAGTDVSGNGNNFTDSGLAANDQVTDTPTNVFCTWNSVWEAGGVSTSTYADGNLNGIVANGDSVLGTLGVSSGKWYFEMEHTGLYPLMGFADDTAASNVATGQGKWLLNNATRVYSSPSGYVTTATTFSAGDVIGFAIDFDNDAVWASKNGTWMNSATLGEVEAGTTTNALWSGVLSGKTVFPCSGSDGGSGTTNIINCGQAALNAGGNADDNGYGDFDYDVPTDFLSLCTANMTALDFDPADHHQVELVNHDGTSTSFTLGWNADTYDTLFIIKNRDSSEKWFWVNGLSGYDKYLVSDTTTAITTDSNVISVSGTTITLGSSAALSSDNYVIECHRAGAAGGVSNSDGDITTTVSANTVSGFSLVIGTLGASASTVYTLGHGLSVAPEMIVMREPTAIGSHKVYNVGNDATAPEDYEVVLNTTGARAAGAYAGNAAPTSSLFSMSTASWGTSKAILAYCWAGVEGYSAFGSYEGNASTDGAVVNTGIKPTSLFIKNIDSTVNWSSEYTAIVSYNPVTLQLRYNLTGGEAAVATADILSNGRKARDTGTPQNSAHTFIYGIWGTPTVNKSETPAKAR